VNVDVDNFFYSNYALTLNGSDNFLLNGDFVLSGENTFSFRIYLDDINKVSNMIVSNADTDAKNLLYLALNSSSLVV